MMLTFLRLVDSGLSGLALCLFGGHIPEGGIEPLTIVVSFDAGEQVAPGGIPGWVASLVHEFGGRELQNRLKIHLQLKESASCKIPSRILGRRNLLQCTISSCNIPPVLQTSLLFFKPVCYVCYGTASIAFSAQLF
jgi:hypothetical protein